MAWTYSDYITLEGTSKLTQLRLHVQEVSDRISDFQSLDDGTQSATYFETSRYLSALRIEEQGLANSVSTSRSPFTRGRSRRS